MLATKNRTFRGVSLLLIILLGDFGPAGAAPATEAWENGRAYTAMLEDAAAAAAKAATAAAGVAAAAAADVATAQAAVAAAGGTAVATTAETVAALEAAEAALASATAIAAATAAAAKFAAAALLGAAIGTYIGQGLRGIWDWCWDPLCDATADNPGIDIYVPATQAEIDAVIPVLSDLASDGNLILTRQQIEDGGVPSEFVAQGVSLFIGAARGAAAGTAGRWDEVVEAASDLDGELLAFRLSVEQYADVIDSTAFEAPDLAALASARAAFDSSAAQALAVCDTSGGDDCDSIASALSNADSLLQIAEAALSSASLDSFAMADLIEVITLEEFYAFLAATDSIGEAALPLPEIQIADTLLNRAGVSFPSATSFGPALAAYDAQGDEGGREGALFDPADSTLTHAQLLRKSATTLSQNGRWLNIDLQESPLVQEATDLPWVTSNGTLGVEGLQSQPNPFRIGTEIRYYIPTGGPVTLDIFDVSGVRVRSLLVGRSASRGRNVAVWDGLDNRGQTVPSGLYFVRMKTPGGTVTHKMTLVR